MDIWTEEFLHILQYIPACNPLSPGCVPDGVVAGVGVVAAAAKLVDGTMQGMLARVSCVVDVAADAVVAVDMCVMCVIVAGVVWMLVSNCCGWCCTCK